MCEQKLSEKEVISISSSGGRCENMNKTDIEYKILELKNEYLQVQDNLEKLEYVNGNIRPLENRLTKIEEELKSLYNRLKTI